MTQVSGATGEAGYILHARPWRDTSLLLEVVLRESGRRGVIARGARSNMRQRGRLQPFRPLWLELAGRGELAQLRSVEEMHALPALRGRVLACGYYLNELLMRLLPRDDAHPELFDAYARALAALACGASEAPVLRGFEKELLEQLGWAPDWNMSEDGQPIEAGRFYRMDTEQGIMPCLQHDPEAVAGLSLLHLAEQNFDAAATARDIRLLLHRLLAPQLGSKPLQSRELLKLSFAGK
ncbi:MAG: DNA repair protein RecO [Gammaproteobacteria bacterium 28-57-27]|nr:MAG: DNA repair protein RecO [Gammaproteobacteria bacterium 28-57-27]